MGSVTNNFATMQTFHLGDLQISNTSISHHDFKLHQKAIWKPHQKENGIEIKGYQRKEESSDYEFFHLQLQSHHEAQIEKCYTDLKQQCENFHQLDGPILVLLNPESGKKQSMAIFEKTLKPLLDDYGISFELFVTKRAKEAEDYLQSVENLLVKYSAIVIVSGDGLLFEVVQGLFKRSDIDEILKAKLPIGIVPGGSGNGLAKSLAHYNKEDFTCFHSCLNVVSGKSTLMDLIRVKIDDGRILHSFLSIGYGFTSDCDIESEYLRFIGEARFTLYSLWLLILLRSYRARITYKLANQSEADHLTETEDDFVFIYCVKHPWVASSICVAPSAKIDDGTMWLLLIRRRLVNRFKVFKIMLGFDNPGQYLNVEGVELLPVTYFKLETLSEKSYITVDGEVLEGGVNSIEANVVPKSLSILTK